MIRNLTGYFQIIKKDSSDRRRKREIEFYDRIINSKFVGVCFICKKLSFDKVCSRCLIELKSDNGNGNVVDNNDNVCDNNTCARICKNNSKFIDEIQFLENITKLKTNKKSFYDLFDFFLEENEEIYSFQDNFKNRIINLENNVKLKNVNLEHKNNVNLDNDHNLQNNNDYNLQDNNDYNLQKNNNVYLKIKFLNSFYKIPQFKVTLNFLNLKFPDLEIFFQNLIKKSKIRKNKEFFRNRIQSKIEIIDQQISNNQLNIEKALENNKLEDAEAFKTINLRLFDLKIDLMKRKSFI